MNRLGLLLLILMLVTAMTVTFTLLIGAVTQAFAPQKVQVVYHREAGADGSLMDVILKPMKHLLSSTMLLMGFENEHKTRRKRDLDDVDNNRIQMVDDNQLEKSEQSDEDTVVGDFGAGIDGTLQRLTQRNLKLKIVYAPSGSEGNRNDIMRSMRKRRRRKRSAEEEGSMREKRRAQEYQDLRQEYSRRCKKEAPDEKDCSKYCEKFEHFLKEAKHSYKEIKHKLSGLLKECKGKHNSDLKGELIDSFPKRKDKKLHDKHELDLDEEASKVKKKDKPKPTVIDQTTDSTTLNEDHVTTVPTTVETTTLIENSSATSEASVVTTEHNTQSAGDEVILVTLVPIQEETTFVPFAIEFQEALEQFEDNAVDESTWSVLKPISTATPTALPGTTVAAVTSTEQNTKSSTLDDLIKAMNETSGPQPFNAKQHNPVEDDCVKNLDDLLKQIPEFRSNDDEKLNCSEATTESLDKTLVSQPEISKFKKQNLNYNPDEHRPKTEECIKSLDDLLEAVDMEHGGLKKSVACKPSSTTAAPNQHRSGYPDASEETLYEEYARPPPPFHEEQFDQSTLPVEVHDFIMGRSRNREQFNHDVPTPVESSDARAATHSNQQTVAASGPFLNLCDQLRNHQHPQNPQYPPQHLQHSQHQAPIKTLSSNQHHFQAQQYGGLGQTSIPVTGETLKATSQVMLNSGYGGFNPNHFCFYQVPPTYGAMRPIYAGGQNYPAGKSLPLAEGPTPDHLLNDPVIEALIEPRGDFVKGMLNVPFNIQNAGAGGRSADDPELEGARLVCNFVGPANSEKTLLGNESVALLSSQETFVGSTRARGHHRHCPRGKVPCADGVQCVLSSHLCDSRVDCFDGSDESHCSCLARVQEKRRCDGYVDCPLGEDEMGCFGCDKFSFSCFNNFFEFQAAHHSETKCYTMIEKCDGFNNCLNRKDEQDCTMLVRDLRSPLAFTIGHSVGVLHRNHKGKWYPVCHNPLSLAKEACEAELGPLERDPVIVQHHGDLPGPFIQPNMRSRQVFQAEFTDTCNGLINYVKCPPPKCGSSKQNEMDHFRIKVRGKRNATDMVQIVGGMKAESGAFPFIVGIYRDGKFHCGGSIFNEHWIITAAHCCDNHHRHFYELKAGLLRRRSFAPQVQVSTVTHIIIHRGYNAQKMMNDISLMHSDRPFQYNRWVRPICLPERHMTTNDRDWIWGPKPGTMCTAIGWGALREQGGSPDHLMQVTVPILPFCKHKNDRDGLGICAADPNGGHDACQGDSGGPFVCVSVTSPHEWYLAGVVSHGDGCARPNEPGVYTRVALFIDWIHKKTNEILPPSSARLTCPGFHCSVGASFCLPKQKRCNGKVDCLGGEDELNCSVDQLLAESVKETTMASLSTNSTEASFPSTTTASSVSSKFDFLEEVYDGLNQTSTKPYDVITQTTTESVLVSTEAASSKYLPTSQNPTESSIDIDLSTTQKTTASTTVESSTSHDSTSSSSPDSTSTSSTSSSEEDDDSTTAVVESVSSATVTTESVGTTTELSISSSTASSSEEDHSTVNYSTTVSTEPTTTVPSSTTFSETSERSKLPYVSPEDYSATTEPTTETSLHVTEFTSELTTAATASSSTESSSTVSSITTVESTSAAIPSEENVTTTVYSKETTDGTTLSSDSSEKTSYTTSTTETSTTETYTESVSSTTTRSDHSHTSTAPVWIQVNEAIAKLKPHTHSGNRDSEDALQPQDVVGIATSDNTTSTNAPATSWTSTTPTAMSTATSPNASSTPNEWTTNWSSNTSITTSSPSATSTTMSTSATSTGSSTWNAWTTSSPSTTSSTYNTFGLESSTVESSSVESSTVESSPVQSSTVESSTVDSSTTSSHDQEHSETQIEAIEATAEEHPFLRDIHELVEEKNRRLNQFRLSMHYLHTSIKNQTLDVNETSYRYKRFVCSKIHQSINIAHHCDRIIDCEDGTDELRCTCRDYLKDKYDFLICDGKTDCHDLTDEENCFTCEEGQFPCRMSKVCIDEAKLCDTVPDCPLHEDELDCLALTDGHKVYFDANNLSAFKYEGLVTKNTNGTWDLICGAEINNKSVESVGKICSFLGFAGHRSFYQTVLPPLEDETVDLEHQPLLIMSYRNITSEPNCKALHITCMPFINATEYEISHFENQHKEQPVQVNIRPIPPIEKIFSKPYITFHENAHIEFIENFGDDYDWPWNADIYLEGVFLCSAIIIDVNWIVVDSSCMRLINLKNDYLSIVAGGAKSYLKIAGPYEQVVRVDCYHFLPEARVVMLHLAKNLTFTRHVLPTFIPEKNHNIEDNQCLAVGQDKYGRTRTLRVHMNMTNCKPEHNICYQLDPDKGIYHADHCYSEDAKRTGVVVCKSKISGWYPVGFYQNKHGLCGFNEVVKMISLKEFYTDIQRVLGEKNCDYTFPEPLCTGLRCRYGKCIGHSLVCDNKMDCDDNSDERPEACNARNDTSTACLPTQFRCGNHLCVDKSKFCNGKNDCGDLSDEPQECSCYTYLKVTNPTKICDGVRNCWDKTDENPRLCKCQKSSFHCGDTDVCIPHDHVCDGDVDCPGEEDERFCYALQQNKAETNFGEVMQQTNGIWHSMCFSKNDTYTDQTIKKICNSVGFHTVLKVYGRKMLQESRLRTANRTHHPVERLRGAATKAVVLNKFSRVAINEKQAFFMKPSRPLFTLINWDAEDEQQCDRLEINCGD